MPCEASALPTTTRPLSAARRCHILPHAAALGVPGERKSAAAEHSERGASKGVLPGAGCLNPGIGGSPGRDGLPIFSEANPPRALFRVSCFGLPFVRRRFFSGIEYYPPRWVFLYPFFLRIAASMYVPLTRVTFRLRGLPR